MHIQQDIQTAHLFCRVLALKNLRKERGFSSNGLVMGMDLASCIKLFSLYG